MSVKDAFTFEPLSIPYLVLAVGFLAAALMVALIRGDARLSRGVLSLVVPACVWAGGQAVMMNVSHAADARPIAHGVAVVANSAVPLIGAGWLTLFVTIAGQMERLRRLVAVMWLVGAIAFVLGVSTDLLVAGMWVTEWGIWWPRGGILTAVHVSLLLLGGVAGVVTLRAELHDDRTRSHLRRLSVIFALAALSTSDVLLWVGVGVYPLSFLPASIAMGMGIYGILRRDFLRSRGFNRVAAWEVGVVFALIPICVAAAWLATSARGGGGAVVLGVILVPVFAVAQLLVQWVRRKVHADRRRVTSRADQALEEFSDFSLENRDEVQLELVLAELLREFASLTDVRLLLASPGSKLRPVGARRIPAAAVDVTERLWAHLRSDQQPVARSEIATQQLGALRAPILSLLHDLAADVLVPLVDREQLVGVIAATSPSTGRALRDEEQQVVQQAARVTAKALTYIALFHEAEARVAIAKEVEVAAAVQQARTPGEDRRRYRICEVTSHYQPGAQFGGDWWLTHELPDGRVLVVMGDINGHGVPAALVSSTVLGACETAVHVLGERLDVLALMELLNEAVLTVGDARYMMSCFAAMFDMERRVVSFSNAGYHFPYVCRPSSEQEDAELVSLIARGTCLGTEDPVLTQGTQPIAENDVVVFYSDALVQSEGPGGVPYGERRLQRVLQRYVLPAGARACEVIVEDARAHYGAQPIADDITLVVLRLSRDTAAEARARAAGGSR